MPGDSEDSERAAGRVLQRPGPMMMMMMISDYFDPHWALPHGSVCTDPSPPPPSPLYRQTTGPFFSVRGVAGGVFDLWLWLRLVALAWCFFGGGGAILRDIGVGWRVCLVLCACAGEWCLFLLWCVGSV